MDVNELSDTAQNIISQASNWSFEGDCTILQWMEQISQALEMRAKNTFKSMDELVTNVNRAQIDLENTQNSLTALQYSQYVEMRCQEETALETENATALEQPQHKPDQQEILQVFLKNNLQMLHNCHDKFNFSEESDEDDGNTASPVNCIYQPRNPYNERLLPHIYGTKIWKEQSHVGLEDDNLFDYSGDEKSEVYSISSSSSGPERGESESPKSHLTANTSQWTSSVSLNNDLNNTNQTIKIMPSISNATSISSLSLNSKKSPSVAQSLPVREETNGSLRTQNIDGLETDAFLKPSNSIKKPTLNLFDDNDYKNLMSAIVEKKESLENSKPKADDSKVDLFGDGDCFSNQKPMQIRNSTQAQKNPSVNLFNDIPREPVRDLFQDVQTKQNTTIKTTLKAKNLFDDDSDEDDDFLNTFANKPQNPEFKKQNFGNTKSLFESDELDRQDIFKDQSATKDQTLIEDQTINSTQSIKPTKSLFFDDEDDSFANIFSKTSKSPKNDSFPVYLSSEPPEDTVRSKLETSLDIDNEADDDFVQIFGSKKLSNTTNSSLNLCANIDNSQNNNESAAKVEQNSKHEQTKKCETKSDKEKVQILNVEAIKSNEPLNKEIIDSDDEFENLFQSKNKISKQPVSQQTGLSMDKEMNNESQFLANKNSENNSNTIIENQAIKLSGKFENQTQSESVEPIFKCVAVKLNDNLGTKTAGLESSNTFIENQAVSTGSGNFIDDKTDYKNNSQNQTIKLNQESRIETVSISVVEDLQKKENLNKNETILKVQSEEEKDSTATDLFESSNSNKANDSMAWNKPPSDESPQISTAKATYEDTVEDDFLDIFKKKKPSIPKLFDEAIAQSAANQTETPQLTQQEFLGELPNVKGTNATSALKEIGAEGSGNIQNITEPIDSIRDTNKITSPSQTPLFDHFSPLFLDEPPDDDDFMQTISASSNSNIVPSTQYTAYNDFYEPIKNNLNTETKADEIQQIHSGYCIRLFDELPPDDNGQYNENDENVKHKHSENTTKNPNTLSNIFASDKFGDFLDNETNQATTSTNAFVENTKESLQFNQQSSSVITKVQAFERPLSEEGTLKPSKSVSKIQLPKIDINVQALLPNASGKTNKRKIEAEKSIDQQEQTATEHKYSETKTDQESETTKNYLNEPENSHLLPSLCKSRIRVPVKRKSSTRAGRQERYHQTLAAEVKANEYITGEINEHSNIGDGFKVQAKNQHSTSTQQHQEQQNLLPSPTISTVPSLQPTPQPSKLTSPTFVTATKQSVRQHPIISDKKLFSDSDEQDDKDDDFFSKLPQPQLPKAVIEKSVAVSSQILFDDSDDDLFASKDAKVDAKSNLNNPKTVGPTTNQSLTKPPNIATENLKKPNSKTKGLFESESSCSEDDNDFNDLFKASKTSKTTLQTTTKATAKINTKKSAASQKIQSKNKSLFSDSEDDDDGLFGSNASKIKNSRVDSIKTTTAKDPLRLQQQETQENKAPLKKTADNPLADLLDF